MRYLAFKPFLLFLWVTSLLGGCSLFGTKDNEQLPNCNYDIYNVGDGSPNFGLEGGYFSWFEGEKQFMKRDRNHLSIRFYEAYGQAHHDSVLQAYGIEPVWSQTYGREVPMPGFYRVSERPAEAYYTTYGDTSLDRLGNLPDVEYILPVFYRSEQFCDLRLTPIILCTFEYFITEERQEAILDSLKAADNITLRQLFPGEKSSPLNIYVTKSSRADPYTLAHHYHQLDFFKISEMNFNYTAGR